MQEWPITYVLYLPKSHQTANLTGYIVQLQQCHVTRPQNPAPELPGEGCMPKRQFCYYELRVENAVSAPKGERFASVRQMRVERQLHLQTFDATATRERGGGQDLGLTRRIGCEVGITNRGNVTQGRCRQQLGAQGEGEREGRTMAPRVCCEWRHGEQATHAKCLDVCLWSVCSTIVFSKANISPKPNGVPYACSQSMLIW